MPNPNPSPTTRFKKGHKPLSHRQKGSLSLLTYLKIGLQEIIKDKESGDKKERAKLLIENVLSMAINKKDKDMIKLIFNYVEGTPKESLELEAKIGLGKDIKEVIKKVYGK